MREFRLLLFLDSCQNLKILYHFEIFVTTGTYGGGISKHYSYNFHPIWTKLYDKYGSHIGI